MKNFMKVFSVLIIAVLVFTMMQPERYQFKKVITVNAADSEVYEVISDLKMWPQWSPWFEDDQSIFATFSNKSNEMGGYAEWESDSYGKGKRVISELERDRSIRLDINFEEPYQHKTKTQFLLINITQKETQLTCVIYGKNESLLEKFLYMVKNLEKKINTDYDRALQNIKTIAEQRSN